MDFNRKQARKTERQRKQAEKAKRSNLEKAAPDLYKVLEDALKNMESDAVQCNIGWQAGLFCGLEDRNITDRYEACMYGYEQALEKVQEWVLCGFAEALAKAKE